MARFLEIACLQSRSMADFDAAIDEALPLAKSAVESGAKVLFLPEYCGGFKTDGARLVPPAAPEASHPFVLAMKEFAAANSVAIMVGSIAVPGPGGKLLNRGLMIDETGATVGRYDKIHLFDANLSKNEIYRESDSIAPGSEAVNHHVSGTTIGHTICYDLRFPILFRDLAQAGAEILACPAAFLIQTGPAHWHALNRARAIENGAFVVSACAVGEIPGGGESYGHSLVINPWGEVIADGGDTPGVLRAQIDLDLVQETRTKVPSLSHDRPFGLNEFEKGVA